MPQQGHLGSPEGGELMVSNSPKRKNCPNKRGYFNVELGLRPVICLRIHKGTGCHCDGADHRSPYVFPKSRAMKGFRTEDRFTARIGEVKRQNVHVAPSLMFGTVHAHQGVLEHVR